MGDRRRKLVGVLLIYGDLCDREHETGRCALKLLTRERDSELVDDLEYVVDVGRGSEEIIGATVVIGEWAAAVLASLATHVR